MHVLNCVLFKITNSLADPRFKQDQNSTYRVTEADGSSKENHSTEFDLN